MSRISESGRVAGPGRQVRLRGRRHLRRVTARRAPPPPPPPHVTHDSRNVHARYPARYRIIIGGTAERVRARV